jgi:GNAT superfamily N-acetyltransferase
MQSDTTPLEIGGPPRTARPAAARHGRDEPRGAPSVRLLREHDVPAAAAVLARAFADEPSKRVLLGPEPGRWAPFADADTRTRFTEASARVRLLAAMPYAAVHVAELDGTIAGVAVWYPPGVTPGALPSTAVVPALLTSGTRVLSLIAHLASSLWRDRSAVRRVLAARTAAAKSAGRGPIWYLAVLGTDPDVRRRGVARRLIERTLERCDVEGLPAWLETTEGTTAAMYERFGFETVAAIPGGVLLPGLWVMRREARGRHETVS